jgi:hypothetical protein
MTTTCIGIVHKGKLEFDPPLALPDGSRVQVTVSPIFTEREALGKANLWLAHNVGDAVGAMNGTLIYDNNQVIWRFEAFVTGAHFDPLGPIGQLEVEANTGRVLSTSQTAKVMIEHGYQFTSVA